MSEFGYSETFRRVGEHVRQASNSRHSKIDVCSSTRNGRFPLNSGRDKVTMAAFSVVEHLAAHRNRPAKARACDLGQKLRIAPASPAACFLPDTTQGRSLWVSIIKIWYKQGITPLWHRQAKSA
jgi:hypothetical protein